MSATSEYRMQSEFRAGGTDVSERRRSGLSRGALIDLEPSDGSGIHWDDEGKASIGAFTTIATIASDPRMRTAYPGLSATAAGLATPQIRNVATIGGNLVQHSRCWYYRNPHVDCLRKGGDECPARSGNHLYHVAFDLGPCIAPHPSSMAAALLAHDATIDTDRRSGVWAGDLFGDGRQAGPGHTLQPGELIQSIALPTPVAGERALYRRAISRSHAEWPLVEVCARAVITDGRFDFVRLAAGGIAPVPLRLHASEAVLLGAGTGSETIADAARRATANARPLPMTAYKLDLLSGLVQDLLGQLVQAA